MSRYQTTLSTPSVSTYQALRLGAGLSARTAEAAEKGLKGSLFAVQILCDGEPVGMAWKRVL